MKSNIHKIIALFILFFSTQSIYAGIDWSRYGDGPDFFLGWETSFFFAIATIVLFGLSWLLTDSFKGKDGTAEGGIGCFVSILNVAMIICAVCSFYLLIPLGILYVLTREIKENEKKNDKGKLSKVAPHTLQKNTKISKPEKVEICKKPIESPQIAQEDKILAKKTSTNIIKQNTLNVEVKPFETPEYTLSPDKKILQRAKDVEIIHVPLGVEVIQKNAFEHLQQLKEVILPNSLKEIGSWAFSFSSIEKIVIPSSVEKIGENCFFFCKNLKDVEIQHGIKRLGFGMFADCDSLKNIVLPSSMISVPNDCFNGCTCLQNISLPENLKYIGDDAFCSCHSLSEIKIPDSVTNIGIEAFRECYELKSVVIPHKVVGLSEYLFYDDYQLKEVVLPDELTSIMSHVFGNCTPLNIRLPQLVSHIEKDAFSQCDELILFVPNGKKEWYENNLDDVTNHIFEYEPESEYILSEEINERTKAFLVDHKEKVHRRSNEMMEALGFPSKYDDDFFIDGFTNEYNDVFFDDDF